MLCLTHSHVPLYVYSVYIQYMYKTVNVNVFMFMFMFWLHCTRFFVILTGCMYKYNMRASAAVLVEISVS